MADQNTAVEKVKEKAAATKTTDIRTMIQQSVNELGRALPRHMNAERLVRIALTTLRLNPELYKCTPQSFLGALFQSAQLGLEPNIEGQAYILPFNNRRKIDGQWKTLKEAQFIIGYKGYVELYYRHQSAVSLDFQEVCKNDEFDFEYGTNSFLKHRPALNERGEVIYFYAVARMRDGAYVFKVMTKRECIEHGMAHSKCFDKKEQKFYDNTPWTKDENAMCKKTVLLQLQKLLPKSIEIQRAIAMDETVKTKVDKDMFDVKDEADWTQAENDEVTEQKQGELL